MPAGKALGPAILLGLFNKVAPLDPDLVCIWKGEINLRNAMLFLRTPQQAIIDPSLYPEHSGRVLVWLREHFALARLVDRVFSVRVACLTNLSSQNTNWCGPTTAGDCQSMSMVRACPSISIQFARIGRDRKRGTSARRASGYIFFSVLAQPGLRLSPDRHRYIFQQLNTGFVAAYLCRNKADRKLSEPVFPKVCREPRRLFIDLAGRMPRDPDLFSDAVHMTEAGVRLQGLITFALLAPTVESKIKSGEWPRPAQRFTSAAGLDSPHRQDSLQELERRLLNPHTGGRKGLCCEGSQLDLILCRDPKMAGTVPRAGFEDVVSLQCLTKRQPIADPRVSKAPMVDTENRPVVDTSSSWIRWRPRAWRKCSRSN